MLDLCTCVCSTNLQDLACAVLGNLFCDPEEAGTGAEKAGQGAELDLLDGSAANKLLVGLSYRTLGCTSSCRVCMCVVLAGVCGDVQQLLVQVQ